MAREGSIGGERVAGEGTLGVNTNCLSNTHVPAQTMLYHLHLRWHTTWNTQFYSFW